MISYLRSHMTSIGNNYSFANKFIFKFAHGESFHLKSFVEYQNSVNATLNSGDKLFSWEGKLN